MSPTRKIRDLTPVEKCSHPEHDPPQFRVFEEGVWEHICPKCGTRKLFTIRRILVKRGSTG